MLAKVVNKPQSERGMKRSVCFLTVLLCLVKVKYICSIIRFYVICNSFKAPPPKNPITQKNAAQKLGFCVPFYQIWNPLEKK